MKAKQGKKEIHTTDDKKKKEKKYWHNILLYMLLQFDRYVMTVTGNYRQI